jgi:hypothetical protein
MSRIAEIGDLISHARRQGECASILQFTHQFAAKNEQDMATVTPMVSKIAGCIFNHPYTQIAKIKRPPICRARFAGVFGRLY